MNRLSFKATLLVVVLLALAGCAKSGSRATKEEKITGRPEDPPVNLEAQWISSNRYTFRIEITSCSAAPRANSPKPVPQETTIAQDYVVTVTNTMPNGSRGLDLELRTLQLEMSLGDNLTTTYDSENRVIGTFGDPTAEALQNIVGAHLRYVLSASNTVIRLDGIKELTDRVLGGNTRNSAASICRRYFNAPYFKQLVELNALPPDAVRVGDSWPMRRELSYSSAGAVARIDVTCTFKGWQQREKRKCALLEFTGAIKPPRPEGRLARIVGAPDVSGSLTGKTWFDPESGFATETITDQTLTYQSTARRPRGADTNAPPTTFMTTQRQRVRIKLLETGPTAPADTGQSGVAPGK